MAHITVPIYLSYGQLCIFISSLPQPFNEWTERHFSQGFSWRRGSVSFRSLLEEGIHNVNVFVNTPVPSLDHRCIRAFRVPFAITEGEIEIGSISDSSVLELPVGDYSLQVEFMDSDEGAPPDINVRFNLGDGDFSILRADSEIIADCPFELVAAPAS